MVEYVQNLAIENYTLHIGHVLGAADVSGNTYSLSMVPEADGSGPSTSMLGIPLCANREASSPRRRPRKPRTLVDNTLVTLSKTWHPFRE